MRTDILKPFLVIKEFVKAGKSTAAKAATALSAAALGITAGYPKGAARGDYDTKMTLALPAIWKGWVGFEKAAGVLK
ncbi:MAG: hypothetical protein OSB69_21690 [Alphaproteobacteria bacterium]|nr:hypothetical protein [Alphaproteobacteria bacterium]